MPTTEGLLAAIYQCTERRLLFASTWATELYASSQKPASDNSDIATGDDAYEEADVICVAQALFDNRKLYSIPHLLRDCKSSKARFLNHYAQYLVGEKKAQDVWNGFDGRRDQKPTPVNTRLQEISEGIGETNDPFLLFLRAIILVRMGRQSAAKEDLIKSVTLQPWNWSAWLQLSCCLETTKELNEVDLRLPKHLMKDLFFLRMGIEMHLPSEMDVKNVDTLLQAFPESCYLMSQKAQVCFQQKDWITAEQIWDHILNTNPHRVDDIDQYSNMLFVMKKKDKLFKVAHDYLQVEEVRPEVQVLIGNYYSMMDDHDKAIKYFRQAVQLDKYYKTAWTLIGHEYTYLKNFHAAIEAYRRAIDISQLDYRAWYGLGRAYDGLIMPTYAINYYARALSLYSYDSAIWEAAGMTYVNLNKPLQALQCLKKGLAGASSKSPTDHERILYLKVSSLFESIGDYESAADCHRQVIAIGRKLGKPVSDYARSCTSLARYHLAEAMDALKQRPVIPISQKAGPNVASSRQYLELLIADDTARGGTGNEEVVLAREMLKKLDSVILQ